MSDTATEPKKEETLEEFKSEPTTEAKVEVATTEESAEPLDDATKAKVKRQIEYYFSDSNYPRDKFLLEKEKLREDGFIEIAVLTTFNRLKSLTTNVSQIANAVEDSDVVVLSEDKKFVKRKNPLPEKLNADNCTALVTGLPKEVPLEELQEFFSAFGKVNSCRILRKNKKPSGDAFVEFATEEELQQFLTKEGLKYKENDLQIKKAETMEEKKSKLLAKRSQSDKRDKKEKPFTAGCLVKFSGFKEDSKINPLQLKTFLNSKEIVAAYVDLAGTSGIIRAPNPEAAAKVLQFTEPFEGTTLSFAMVEGDDEKTYYAKLNCNTQKKHARKKFKRF